MANTADENPSVGSEERGPPRFSLLGGPLHRLARRLCLVGADGNTVKLGLALGVLSWAVLAALALLGGYWQLFFSLDVAGIHVRLLAVIPLIFICESSLYPRMASFVESTLRGGLVNARSLPELDALIAKIGRWKDSWLLEALCLVVAIGASPLARYTDVLGQTFSYDPDRVVAPDAAAAYWWFGFCLPLTRFLLLRWFVRLALWWYFLWRVSRMELNLLPNHPDGAGGLGGLEIVHRYFMSMIVAFSAIISASFAEEVVAGTMALTELYLILVLLLVLALALFLGPALLFMTKMREARLEGLREFRSFSSRYVQQFNRKWLGSDVPSEPLLGSPDIQSMADLGNSAQMVRSMRVVPLSRSILVSYAMAVVLPFLPLLLFKYPIAELAGMLLTRLSGF